MRTERSEAEQKRANPYGPRERRVVARKLKRIRRRRFVAEQLELWPEEIRSFGDWTPSIPSVSESDATVPF